jgi:hypothetical protein
MLPEEGFGAMLDECGGLYSKGSGVDMEAFACAARFWRRRKRKTPNKAKRMRAMPPITDPTTGPTRVQLFDVEEGVPFWIMR